MHCYITNHFSESSLYVISCDATLIFKWAQVKALYVFEFYFRITKGSLKILLT